MTTNVELTQMCRLIFGDIVSKAYFREEDLRYNSCNIIMRTPLEMDWGAENFVVEFINNATVVFTNSEWASLERLNNANLQQA